MRYGNLEHSGPIFPEPVKTTAVEKILLIDLENCPNQIHELQSSLQEYSRVVICYATTGAKIPLDWLMPLNEIINASRLQIHKMDSVGKNAADFGIFFFAGMLAQELKEPAEFIIASDDTDLDHLVSLLASMQHTAKREGKLKNLPQLTTPVITDVATGVKLYCEHLERHDTNRPASEQTLKNSIRSKMGQNMALTEAVFEQLIKLKVCEIKESKPLYFAAKIRQLAASPV